MRLEDLMESDPYLSKIKAVATQVRQSLEDDAKEYNLARGFRVKPDGDYRMDGKCAIASARLHSELKTKGIDSTFWVNHDEGGHCYLVTDRGYIVDVTATQFGSTKYPKVLITTQPPKGSSIWSGAQKHSGMSELINTLKQHGWHPSAIPKE